MLSPSSAICSCSQSHRTLVCTFAGKQAVVWIRIQLAGNPAPYSREISAGRMLSAKWLSVSHTRVNRRGPAIDTADGLSTSRLRRGAPLGAQHKAQIEHMLGGPAYLIGDQQALLAQLHRPLVLNAQPRIARMRRPRRDLIAFRDRDIVTPRLRCRIGRAFEDRWKSCSDPRHRSSGYCAPCVERSRFRRSAERV